MTHDIIVQKYGGSSVADAARIKHVAQFIKSFLRDQQKIVVVVSAMGHTTNELIALAHDVSRDPPKRELDMLISCGERSSMALLAMALSDIDVQAISLTGSQSGIITDEHHHGAEIIAIKPQRVLDAFDHHQVVIVAGFQGVSEKKEITTLRRGGSDTTAVAMAAAVNARLCEIYTDVDGVMDCDPRIVEAASIIPAITFDKMESMALYGARVLAHDAIRLAKDFNVHLRIARTGQQHSGTTIASHALLHRNNSNTVALTHLRALVRITVPFVDAASIDNQSGYFLCGTVRDDSVVAYISNDISQELTSKSSHIDAGLALITIHLGKNHAVYPLLTRIHQIMAQHRITYEDLIISGTEIFVIVRDEQLNDALRVFHDGIMPKTEMS